MRNSLHMTRNPMSKFTAIVSLIFGMLGSASLAQSDGFLWRVTDITAEVARDDKALRIGQYLRLRQTLRAGESGWTEMKIDIPETWKVQTLSIDGERVVLVNEDGSAYHLARENVGALSSKILMAGSHPDDNQLQRIWQELAPHKLSR
jgi:hypothetical protein